MHSEELQSYLTNIEEFIFDDKKIVTFSWLSKHLGIHSNLSKQLLHTFFESSPKKEELSVTYLVIGLKKETETCLIAVVKDKDLDSFEQDLEVITSVHVYSVQKCQELTDLNVLYTAQKDESVDTISKRISSIDFNCNERDDALIAKLRHGALPTVSNQPAFQPKKSTLQPTNKTKSPVKNVKSEETDKKNSSEESKESAPNQDAKGSNVHPMFKNVPASKKKQVGKVPVNSKKTGGIGAFFSKTSKPVNTSNDSTKPVVPEKPKEEEKLDPEVKKRLSPLKENKGSLNVNIKNDDKQKTNIDKKVDSSEIKEDSDVKSKKAPAKSSKATKKVDTKKGKKGAAKKPAKEEKKRKRLVLMSDSDSDNSEEEEAEMEREPTPEPEPTVVPDDDDMICGTPEPSTRKRKKKLVSKSFTSSDGYMMTEKVLVSCSEEEEEEMPEKKFKGDNGLQQDDKKNEVKSTNKDSSQAKKTEKKSKISSPQKTKQASLMNFFKKK